MTRLIRRRVFVILCLFSLLAGCQQQLPPRPVMSPASEQAIRNAITYLSSDALEGRGVGTLGLDVAGEYIAGYFKGLELRPPPGQESYFQPFDYTVITGPASSCTLGGDVGTFTLDKDFRPMALSGEKSFSGPLVFAGYGISGAEEKDTLAKYDDYAGLDVKGKVVIVLRYEPHDANGKSRIARRGWSESASIATKARTAAQQGAAALLVVSPPLHHGDDALEPFGRRQLDAVSIPVIQITRSTGDRLLQAGGSMRTLKELQAAIDQTFQPHSEFLLGSGISGKVALAQQTYHLRNVIAYIPGSGPRAKEFIVIGGHYDHLGRGGPGSRAPGSHEIHHGADDNASGTAAILELARILSSTTPLPRSVLIIAFSGEERGLLGSNYWVDHPSVPLKQVKAMINLDMVGRLHDNTLQIGGTGTAAPLDAMMQSLNAGDDFKLKTAWKDGKAPSDVAVFVARRVPSIFFWTGFHADYHRPTDTADKINYPGETRIVNMVVQAATDLAYLSDKQLTFTPPPPRPPTTRPTSAPAGEGVSLGVIPDYAAESGHGVRITGTSPDSPADKAGLHPGDLIVRFGDWKVENLYDLTDALDSAAPGVPVRIQVMRNGQRLELEAIPTARRRRQE